MAITTSKFALKRMEGTLIENQTSIDIYGDGTDATITASLYGGNDTIYGSNYQRLIVGDTANSFSAGRGGDDLIVTADNTFSMVYGDTMLIQGNAVGGNDTIFASDFDGESEGVNINLVSGDAMYFGKADRSADNSVLGGNDAIHLGNVDATDNGFNYVVNVAAGDTLMYQDGHSTGGSDTIWGGAAEAAAGDIALSVNLMSGDSALGLWGYAKGGADKMVGGDAIVTDTLGLALTANIMLGDALSLTENASAGNDDMKGGDAIGRGEYLAVNFNFMSGDTLFTLGTPKFGNDRMEGGDGEGGLAVNVMFGDAIGSLDQILGLLGSRISGSFGFDFADMPANYGVVNADPMLSKMTGMMKGGDDSMAGGDDIALNAMFGDALYMLDNTIGGNDVIRSGNTAQLGDLINGFLTDFLQGNGINLPPSIAIPQNLLVGDALIMAGNACGGKDTLISGNGGDLMVGDGIRLGGARGAGDIFVFGNESGHDVILDFNRAEGDKIDLRAYGFQNFEAFSTSVTINDFGGIGKEILLDGGHDSIVVLNGGQTVTLTQDCFLF